MAENENIRNAREALAEVRALAQVSARLREKSERLAEEDEVLRRAAAILQARAQEQARG
jgi:hypothetical protein